jgi:uncharacterized membrane protein
MLPYEVDEPVRLCQSFKGTAGAFEIGRILFRMAGGNVQGQRLGVEEFLFASSTCEWKMPLMRFQMIVHGVLVLFHNLTDSADKVSLGILLVCIWHL